MKRPLFLSVDLEDQTETYELNGRYVAMTYRLLNLFREQNRRATFFTVGRMIRSAPDLIREIADMGHEIAFHSHAHLSLTEEDPEIFRRETADDKDRLEQLIGRAVVGFRAPRYSLQPRTAWALDILGELGFRYSSSIMPTKISRFGFCDAPRVPFTWQNGLIEYPLPVVGPGKFGIPFSGGVYLYLSPQFFTRKALDAMQDEAIVWTYMHPYDFDIERKIKYMPNTPLWVRTLLSLAGLRAPKRVKALLMETDVAPLTFADLTYEQTFVDSLPKYSALQI